MGRVRNATDLGIDLDRIAARRAPREWVYLEGVEPWEMVDHAAAFLGMGPCPVCKGLPLKDSHYCSACDRCGLDGQCPFPGLPVDSAPDPDWSATATSYVEGILRGGK